eukprot:c3928_g1_i3.p1 GENE.c3928_g1_i3~~c3928_g1_i3.p1  ORF type:complete len:188 (+),score=39.89 c3928_g1_i3:28-564(+)
MFDFIQEGQVDELAKYIEEHKSSANVFDVNQQDTRPGWLMFSGIHHAAFKGHANVCQFLIANGANVNIKDKVGWTPIVWAATKSNVEVTKLLLDAGAHFSIPSKNLDQWLQAQQVTPELLQIVREHYLSKWYTFCMGAHDRVGVNSHVRVLVDDVMEKIFQNLWRNEVQPTPRDAAVH